MIIIIQNRSISYGYRNILYNIHTFPSPSVPILKAALTAGEGKQREEVEEDELEDVHDHPRE